MSTATELHPIFAECCSEDGRYRLDEPFVIGRYIYATDGRIVVRAPANGMDQSPGDRLPPVEELPWPKLMPPVTAIELPEVGDGMTACEDCGGSGKLEGDDLPAEECWECDGTGKAHDFASVPLGHVILSKWYVSLLKRHGVVWVFPIDVTPIDKSAQIGERPFPSAFFSVGAFEGLVMGKRA